MIQTNQFNSKKEQLFKKGLRKCFACKNIFELNENNFYKSTKKRFNGFQYICKKCNYNTKTLWNKNNLDKVRAYKISYNKTRGYLKVRFEILKRDNFTCQYCERKAPNVVLEIDHVIPKSKGGINSFENYKTACLECNRGKYNFLLGTGN